MTDTTALRDRLAELCGYRKIEPQHPLGNTVWVRNGIVFIDCNGSRQIHPFPPNDYNALIAAWPEEWWWVRCCCDGNVDEWRAGKNGGFAIVCIPDNGDEYADRLRLTIAVLEANP